MQQVRCRVVQSSGLTTLAHDTCGECHAWLHRARYHRADVQVVAAILTAIHHIDDDAISDKLAEVTDLSARLGIERRLI